MRHHGDSMTELELTRTKEDRRIYALGDLGTLRVSGFWFRSATAQAGHRTWDITGSGVWRRIIRATDEAGAVVGEFTPRGGLRRGGSLRWGDRTYDLRPASSWRERYAMVDAEREVAVLDGKGWGKRPVAVTLLDPSSIPPGLLLFAVFVVRGLAHDASSAGSSGTVAASSAGCI
jgi:hypothetical protein